VVSIRTPENIELSYVLAGPGSRAAAYLLDFLVMTVVCQMLINLIIYLVGRGPSSATLTSNAGCGFSARK
jgi:uncharacterized RDD family membrane protein YckC